jgi:hypothetical protein
LQLSLPPLAERAQQARRLNKKRAQLIEFELRSLEYFLRRCAETMNRENALKNQRFSLQIKQI